MTSFGSALLWFALGGFVYSVLSKIFGATKELYIEKKNNTKLIELIVWLEGQGEMDPEKRVLVRQFIVDWLKTICPELFKAGVFDFHSWKEMVEFEKKHNKTPIFKDKT